MISLRIMVKGYIVTYASATFGIILFWLTSIHQTKFGLEFCLQFGKLGPSFDAFSASSVVLFVGFISQVEN